VHQTGVRHCETGTAWRYRGYTSLVTLLCLRLDDRLEVRRDTYCDEHQQAKTSQGEHSTFQQLELLLDLAAVISQAKEAREIYRAAVQGLVHSLSADRAAVRIFDPDGVLRFKESAGLSEEYRAAAEARTPWRRGATDVQPIAVSDVLQEASLSANRQAFAREGIRAIVFIPLMANGGLIGKFGLYYNAPHEFQTQEIRVSQAIATHVARAWERQHVENALRETEQRFVSIYNTVEDIIFHLAIEPEGQFRIVSVNAAFLRVTGLSQEKVVGKTVNEVVPEPSLTIVLGKYRQAIEENTIVRWEETSDYPAGRLTGEVSVAPVFDNTGTCTHLVGSVHDITEVKRAREIEDRLTSNLAASRDEIRALAAGLMRAQEDERRRVSRELHDHICHQLGSLAVDIGKLAVSPLPPENWRSHLAAIQARLVKTSQETHHIAYQMRTAVLDDLGLVASLKDLCSEFSEHYPDIALDFEDSGPPASIPSEVASCLYRIAEESLENIAKHSRAKSVSVRLTFKTGAVVLTIQDDGFGFDSKAVKGNGGLGLISMKERAHSVNGKLTITAALGHGTRISLEAPLAVSKS
jgi:PAS domain S-box-containing protein